MPMSCAQILHTFSHSNLCPWPCNSAVPPTKTEYNSLILEIGLIHMTCLANKMSPDEKEVRVKCVCLSGIALWCFCHRNRRMSLPGSLAQGGWENMEHPHATVTLELPSLIHSCLGNKCLLLHATEIYVIFLSDGLFPNSVSNLSVLHVLIHLNFFWIL